MGKDNGVLARNGHTKALLDLPRMAGLAPGGALIEILNEDGIMALNQRILKILNLIREDGHAKVQELSRIFNVTDVTIRQDLEELEKQGFVLREHGGTFLKDAGPFAKAGKVFNQTRLEGKRLIAKKAVSTIEEGECIILDSGSTTTEISISAHKLQESHSHYQRLEYRFNFG